MSIRAMCFFVAVFTAQDCRLHAQPGPRPDSVAQGYEHDKWNTEPKDYVHEFRAYTSSFDGPDDDTGDGRSDVFGIPEWVSYELRRGPNRSEYESRPAWHTIVEWYRNGVAPADPSYLGSDYERGHLCMRQHARRLGKNADWNSHSMINAFPQEGPFNRGHWFALEKRCDLWSQNYGKVWVICGPVIGSRRGSLRPYDWIGDPGEMLVAVPYKAFKIVVKESDNPSRPDVLAFIFDNHPELNDGRVAADLRPNLRAVREIEERTGLNFFASLSAADQRAIEMKPADDLWPNKLPDVGRFALLKRQFPTVSEDEIEQFYDSELAVEDREKEAASPPTALISDRSNCYRRFRCCKSHFSARKWRPCRLR